MTRPREVTVATALMSAFNVAAVAFYEPSEGASAGVRLGVLAVLLAVVVASFVVIWFSWTGRNWARWLVMAMSIVALLDLLSFGTAKPAFKGILVAEALLGGWLLCWLNTTAARVFFRSGEARNQRSMAGQ